MFHSHSHNEEVFGIFTAFLQNAIEGKDAYKSIVNPIIQDAHSLAIGEKDFYKINRSNFPVIVYLVEKEHEYFRIIQPNNITKDNYTHILDLVTQQRDLLVY